MNGFPPPILVETWIYLAINRNIDLAHLKLHYRRLIKKHFGSMELAQLYLDGRTDKDIEVHFV